MHTASNRSNSDAGVKDGLPDLDRGILLQTLCSGDGISLKKKEALQSICEVQRGEVYKKVSMHGVIQR